MGRMGVMRTEIAMGNLWLRQELKTANCELGEKEFALCIATQDGGDGIMDETSRCSRNLPVFSPWHRES